MTTDLSLCIDKVSRFTHPEVESPNQKLDTPQVVNSIRLPPATINFLCVKINDGLFLSFENFS